VTRRSPAFSAVLAAALVLAGRTAVTAGGITYSLVNNTGSPLNEADFEVAPTGALQGPPVTIADPIPSVFNFAPTSQGGHPLQVSLGTSPDPKTTNFDGLVFSFVSTQPGYNTTPLPSGDALNFTLNTAPGFTGTPQLSLFDPPSGLALQVINPPSQPSTPAAPAGPAVSQSSAPSGPVNTPEPLSVLLWSALAGTGLVRARKVRRAAVQG
jgi:hypothetical protein